VHTNQNATEMSKSEIFKSNIVWKSHICIIGRINFNLSHFIFTQLTNIHFRMEMIMIFIRTLKHSVTYDFKTIVPEDKM